MDIYEKYDLDDYYDNNVKRVEKIPNKLDMYIYLLIIDTNERGYKRAEIYINNKFQLELASLYSIDFIVLQLFLKKYRDEKQALPKEIIDKRRSNETMQKLMRFMLIPMNNFEEFKERLLLATKEVPAPWLEEDGYRYGDKLVFVSKREEFGKFINIYNEWIPCIKERNEKYWERAILYDKENKIFELYYKEERTNDDAKRTNWSMEIKFYEEKYLYEYLLNREISAVVQN